VRVAWRRGDPAIEADAIDFWRRNQLLPEGVDPAARAKELIAAAYKDGRLAAVATATIGRMDFLRANFAIIRGATAPEFRRSHAQLSLSAPGRAAMHAWARNHPEENYAGAIVFVDRGEWGDFTRLPVWPESELELVGYDQHGRQIRVRWFEDFRYDGPGGAGAPATGPPEPPPPPADIALRPAWRLDHAEIEQDAAAFWRRLGNLPGDVTPEQRAKEVVIAGYQDGRIVGIVTAALRVLPQVRARLAMLRVSVDPELRRSHIGIAMVIEARALLESWSAANSRERLAGIGGIVESPDLLIAQRRPYWPRLRMGVVGFTPAGRQIRVSWFRDFRLD
jgi:hypothetical protein